MDGRGYVRVGCEISSVREDPGRRSDGQKGSKRHDHEMLEENLKRLLEIVDGTYPLIGVAPLTGQLSDNLSDATQGYPFI